MHVSSWSQDSLELRPLLDRLLSVHPLAETQTHLLHLASDGEILVCIPLSLRPWTVH